MHPAYLTYQFSNKLRYLKTAQIEKDSHEGRVGAVNNGNNIGLPASFLGSQ